VLERADPRPVGTESNGHVYTNDPPARDGTRPRHRGNQVRVRGARLTSTITALGATVGAGSASAAMARPAAAAATGVTWHKLTPIDGWQSGEAHFSTGGPAWTVRSGVVYLSGSVFQSSGNSGEIAVLPAAARPSRNLYITVYTANDTQGWLTIYTNGGIWASANPYSNAQGFTSLAGISFPLGS
jgi:hypothetical protein